MTNTWEERVQQAHDQNLGQIEAIALCSRLHRELESYLERRRKRRYHTDFDDLLDDLLPGLAMAISLLEGREALVEDIDGQERWGDLHPDTLALLQRLAGMLGLQYADGVADSLRKEVAHRLERMANERTNLMILIMDWGEGEQYPNIRTDACDIEKGLDAWSSFCGNAPLEHLRSMGETIQLRQQAAERRLKLAQLSERPYNTLSS
jgi:hypothetical protein